MKNLPTLILATAALWLAAGINIQGAASPAIVPQLLTTFTKPPPASYSGFGTSVAAAGSDRVLIGAPGYDMWPAHYAGAAYLFSTNGALLKTFANSWPLAEDLFGYSVAVLGTDRMLIGAFGDDIWAYDAGVAYLYSTNGAKLKTFTNPTPAFEDWFGSSVAAVGTDWVLIGAYGDNTGANYAGAAYLFNTNGNLIITYTNPTPAAYDWFGYSVAAVGTNLVLISARLDDTGATNAGAAYLFSTNGTLLTAFTNPTPAFEDGFGYSLAAVGNDRVLIGEPGDDTGATNAGVAYLFNTNGALFITFTNPTPATESFGSSVAAVGIDRVLIGAKGNDTGATAAGAAYLFSTNGELLTTITNPTPQPYAYFGASVAAVGTNRVLIGAGAYGANGAAYLFSLDTFIPPSLSTTRNSSLSTLTISWPAPAEGWLLEATNALPSVPASSWPPVPPPYQTNAGTISVTFTNSPATGNQFFRLRQP